MGLHTDVSIDAEERRRLLDPAVMNQSFDREALQALHASSVSVQDAHRSQVFRMRAPIAASDSVKGGQITDVNMASSQKSTAAYPFVARHGIRKGGPRLNLSHVQSKLTAKQESGSLFKRTDQSLNAVQRSHAHFRRVQ